MTWSSVSLSSLCMPDAPITYGILQPGPSVAEGVLYVRPTEIKDGIIDIDALRRTTPEIAERYHKSRLSTGDLLITIVGTIGNVAAVPSELDGANITQSSARIRPKSDVVFPGYLRHYLRSPAAIRQYDDNRLGATVPRLNLHHVRDLQIPLPPLTEQKRIAAILDAADALRAKRRESIEQLDSLIQATFLEMFGDPVANPKGWAMTPLKDLAVNILSGTTPKGGEEVYVKGGVMFLRSQNVWKNRLELTDIAYIDSGTHQRMRKSKLQHKDILITKTGRVNTEQSSLGRAAMFLGDDGSANINGHVYLIRLRKGSVHEFVLRILTTTAYRDYIRSVCVGGIDKRQLNKSHIEQFPIIAPPIDLQTRFASIVESIEHQKTRLKSHLAELDALFSSLQSRAFNAELVA